MKVKSLLSARRAFSLALLALLPALWLAPAQGSAGGLELLSLIYPPTADAGQPIVVEATVLHNQTSLPTVTLYYAYFLNQTVLAGGWRFVKAELSYTNGMGVSLYKANIPNPAYREEIPYNSKIIFYLEIKDPSGASLLTCDESARWNPYAQLDKYSILVVDESPPKIVKVSRSPKKPTELDPVTVTVKALDGASGVAKVELHYWVGELERVEAMELTPEGLYAAVIPAEPKGAEVTYYAVAFDNAGNKAFSKALSYSVAASPRLQTLQAKRALTYLAAAAILLLAAAAAYLWRRKPGVERAECKHPKAMTFFMLVAFAAAAALYYQLSRSGSPLVGLLIAAAAVASWTLFDPRASPLPSKLRLDEKPPLTLMAEGWVVALAGAFAVALASSAGFHGLARAYQLAVLIGKYAVGLMAAGLILQLAWPYLKEIEVSIEVEELKE